MSLRDPSTPSAPPLDADAVEHLAEDLLIDADDASTETPAAAPAAPVVAGSMMLIVAIVLVGFNLRPALSSVGPVLSEIMATFSLGGSGAALLTTLPVVCLGLFSAVAPGMGRRLGTEKAILLLMLLLIAGLVLRLVVTYPALLLSGVLVGAAIAGMNVLLPGLVKRDFPHKAALMAGVYTMALCAGASLAAGFTVPLEQAAGGSWAFALAFWAVPAVIATVVWFPQVRAGRSAAAGKGWTVRGLTRDPLAWQVTLFMGLQSSMAYSLFGWLAPILRDRGLDPVQAGWVVSLSILIQVPSSLLAPILATRRPSQSIATVITLILTLIGMLGFIFAPLSTVWVWTLFSGVGLGAAFALGITLIVLRASDSHVAAQLSGMAQGFGYTLASGGPFLVGVLHDAFGGWTAVAILFAVICGAGALFGLGAGRPLHVKAESHPR
ncbi:CynX/NimT family MFS transporter [Novispirillum itersonii]|uniref:CP family cyanate transporter-like MFS transporter n=1 Tax=Novispirillum itersonii TaxID=189 RepID=A0A7X0DN05_NOVIT|nr:MFS transporter [Novispirillum itersonii]MBB6211500.1 CP family cyanate transporter-like MFS transporter [Novispirillum itersonii]